MTGVSAISMFCDDIREEKSGTNTIVGIYSDNLFVPEFPFVFPKLAIYSRIHIPTEAPVKMVSIEFRTPAKDPPPQVFDEELISTNRASAEAEGSLSFGIIVNMIASGLVIPEPTTLSTFINVDDMEFVGGILNVKLREEGS